MNEPQCEELDWLTPAEAAEFLAISRERIGQLIKTGRLPAERDGRYWFVPRASLVVRLAERLAVEPPPKGFLFRMTVPATGETALTDHRRFGWLRDRYYWAQSYAVHAMQPGDRLEFPADDIGPAWTVECLPERPASLVSCWLRVPGSPSLTLDDVDSQRDETPQSAGTKTA